MKHTKTGQKLYKEMVINGKSVLWIEKEYGVTVHYIINKVHGYMMYLINKDK